MHVCGRRAQYHTPHGHGGISLRTRAWRAERATVVPEDTCTCMLFNCWRMGTCGVIPDSRPPTAGTWPWILLNTRPRHGIARGRDARYCATGCGIPAGIRYKYSGKKKIKKNKIHIKGWCVRLFFGAPAAIFVGQIEPEQVSAESGCAAAAAAPPPDDGRASRRYAESPRGACPVHSARLAGARLDRSPRPWCATDWNSAAGAPAFVTPSAARDRDS